MGKNNNTSRKRDSPTNYSNSNISEMSSSVKMESERDRRLKMTHMFTHLQSTVPGLSPQATREVILKETISYIKELENKKLRLEELKKEKMKADQETSLLLPCSHNNNNYSINVTTVSSSNVAFFGIQSVAKPGFITVIFKVFFNHQADILAANVSVNHGKLILAITALLEQNGHDHDHGNNSTIEKIKREILSL